MIRPVPRNEWDLDPAAFGPYGPTPAELVQHAARCECRDAVLVYPGPRQLDPGVSGL